MLVAEYVSFRRELAEVALRDGMATIFEHLAHVEAGGFWCMRLRRRT
ncbi:MAG: hypothetical protein K0R61_1813 [Microvirga sp.]|jgi:hypothetical protein|nr:hypothetical protein [Microvirga sp.]